MKVVFFVCFVFRDVEVNLILLLEKVYWGGKERICLEDGCFLEVEMFGGMGDG